MAAPTNNKTSKPLEMKNRLNERLLVKAGNSYLFTYQQTLDHVPPEIYLPGQTIEGQFFLTTAQSVKHASPEKVNDLLNFLHTKDLIANGQDDINTDHLSVTETAWSDPAFFPMHQHYGGLRKVKDTIKNFIEQKQFYEKNRLDYKRSILLYGEPGTGKSRFVNEMTRQLINSHDAVVIRIESIGQLSVIAERGLADLHCFLQGRMKIFVIEELASLLGNRNQEAIILNFLDSIYLRHDVLFFITTNFPEKIPNNIVDRPSRVDDLVEIKSSEFEHGFIAAWYLHVLGRPFPDSEMNTAWFLEAQGHTSPAYLKELFLYAELHQCSLDQSWKQIKLRRNKIKSGFLAKNEMGFNLDRERAHKRNGGTLSEPF
jgi:hypothetical protein